MLLFLAPMTILIRLSSLAPDPTEALGAGEMVVEDLDSSVAALFDGDPAPASDSDVVSAAPVSQ